MKSQIYVNGYLIDAPTTKEADPNSPCLLKKDLLDTTLLVLKTDGIISDISGEIRAIVDDILTITNKKRDNPTSTQLNGDVYYTRTELGNLCRKITTNFNKNKRKRANVQGDLLNNTQLAKGKHYVYRNKVLWITIFRKYPQLLKDFLNIKENEDTKSKGKKKSDIKKRKSIVQFFSTSEYSNLIKIRDSKDENDYFQGLFEAISFLEDNPHLITSFQD